MMPDIRDRLEEKRIAVFMGGPSEEREISFKSGEAVYQALKDSKLDVLKLDIKSESEAEIRDKIFSFKIDLVFIALHGRFGEDGSLQAILENMGVAYTGSDSTASRLAMDKAVSKNAFKKCGLNVPEFMIVERQESAINIAGAKSVGFPLVVKPSASGSSIGISLVEKEQGLKPAFLLARRFSNSIIVERFIKAREIAVGILADRPLPPIEITTGCEPFFNFSAKYESEDTKYIVPANLSVQIRKRVEEAGIRAHKCLFCRGFSRVDMLFSETDNKIYILEVNTIPGLSRRSLLPKAALAAGLDFSELCLRIMESIKL